MHDALPFDVNTVPLERGINLIEASAGTGKTYSITSLYLRFLLEERLPLEKILAVTYTVAATQELRDRIRTRLRNALGQLRTPPTDDVLDPILKQYLGNGGSPGEAISLLNLAVQTFDEAPIFTIHGFCHRTLQDYAFESGIRYSAETLHSSTELFTEIAQDFWRREFYPSSPFTAALLLSSEAKDLDPDSLAGLLKTSQSHPSLIILPAAPEGNATALLQQAEAMVPRLIQLWCAEAETITALATDTKCLKKDYRTLINDFAEPILRHATQEPDLITPNHISALFAFSLEFMSEHLMKNKAAPEHPFFTLCAQFRASLVAYLQAIPHLFLAYASQQLRERKQSRNLLSFDDLLINLHTAVQPAPDGAPSPLAVTLSAKYAVALIDEFQDTDQLQAEIFTHLFTRNTGQPLHWLYFIGDPKQAIYAFRGADIFSYLTAARSATRRYSLQTNYRSCPKLLQAFNLLFTQTPAPFLFEDIGYTPVSAPEGKEPGTEPPLIFRRFESDREANAAQAKERVLEMLASDLLALRHRAGTPFRFGEMAILVRSNSQADDVQNALRQVNIPSVLHSDKSVFESREAAALTKLLASLVNPRHVRHLKTALLTPLFDLTPEELLALHNDEHAIEAWSTLFTGWRSTWAEHGFIAFYRRFLAEQQLRERAIRKPGGERTLTNLSHLSELLHHEEAIRQLSPDALAEWLHAQCSGERPSRSEAEELRLESDSDAVTIVTIHKSKGLEYPVVFCPFAWATRSLARLPLGCFHDEERRISFDRRPRKQAPLNHTEAYDFETRAEEMRLFYVAVTRAKYRCTLYFGPSSSLGDSPLAMLLNTGDKKDALSQITTFTSYHPEQISLSVGPTPHPGLTDAPPQELPPLSAQTFSSTLYHPGFLTSFTALSQSGAAARQQAHLSEPPERDEALPLDSSIAPPLPLEQKPAAGIFLFERGIRAGDFFHDVLENLDFQSPAMLDELLPKALARHGFPDSPHQAALDAHLRTILDVELQPGLALSHIPVDKRLPEVEFSLHLPELTTSQLRSVYHDYTGPLDAARLTFSTVRGFLRGVIDLLFEHDGRFYILDWKSNWLGNSSADYTRLRIDEAMRHHHYTLQAHLYLLACDRFLHNRIKEYSYSQHFGGIFYLFVRGMTPTCTESGIYFERPDESLVKRLRALQAASPAIEQS